MTDILKRKDAPDLAYALLRHENPIAKPPIVFLGGFRSDMQGTKALFLEEYCRAAGRDFLRFDYSGHGASQGDFNDLCLSDWANDAKEMIEHCFEEPVILVGSSMGGWISLILAERTPQMIAGLIGLAAAPDFTKWMEAQMSDEQKATLEKQGYFDLPNDYGDPYAISAALLEDGRDLSLLHKSLKVDFPISLIQGKKDADVPWETAEKIKDVFQSTDVRITYIEEGDHRLSSPEELQILKQVIEALPV